jgi:hypothetical protein
MTSVVSLKELLMTHTNGKMVVNAQRLRKR